MRNEHRQYKRVKTRLETIYFTETKTDAGYERLYYPGLIMDKSLRGLGIKVYNEHNINDHIWIEGLGTSSDPQQAFIRWTKAITDNAGEFRIGVELQKAD